MLEKLKKEVYKANMLLEKYKLAIHTWGNASQLSDDGKYFAIKPSGVSYEKLKWEDIVILDLDGNVVDGKLNPSSDTDTHLELYKKYKVLKGIAHTHSPYAIAWAQTGKDIPCFGTTHADNFYGSVPCARSLTKAEIQGDYEKNTGLVIIETLEKRKISPIHNPAILVKKHGPFTYSAKGAIDAVNYSLTLEEVARIGIFTISIDQNAKEAPKYLQEKHYNRKHGENSYYGQK